MKNYAADWSLQYDDRCKMIRSQGDVDETMSIMIEDYNIIIIMNAHDNGV